MKRLGERVAARSTRPWHGDGPDLAATIGRSAVAAAHALLVMVVVEALVRTVSLPKLAAALGCRLATDPIREETAPLHLADLTPRGQREINWTRRISHRWPFGPGPCLRESLVVGHLLRHHEPVVRLGLDPSGRAMLAHAWVEIGGRPLEDVGGLIVFPPITPDRL